MTKPYPTPHNSAIPKDFAKTVLMPGDPLRAKFIAENFLRDAVLVNDTKVSVMASGMGMPSMAIYSYELFNFYGVENIMRIGSAGAISKELKIRDIVLGMGACTNSNFAHQYNLPGTFAPICSYKMLKTCAAAAEEMGIDLKVGNLLSSDTFYNDEEALPPEMRSSALWSKMGVMAI